MSLSRRSLISGSAALVAFGGLSRSLAHAQTAERSQPYASDVVGYGPLREDSAGLFDLPEGFSYTVVSRAEDVMDDGLLVPHSADGMGCFALGEDQVVLVRNHEVKMRDRTWSAFGPANERFGGFDAEKLFDRYLDGAPLGGGTTTIVYDLRHRRTVRQHLSLAGTTYNCSGGTTPRRTWLTCEETVVRAGDRVAKDHGWVFEVSADARGPVAPEAVRGLGRFSHEATCTDPRTGIVYLTEDEHDGLFYRFVPNEPANLQAGGRLQALAIRGEPDADPRNVTGRRWSQGDWLQTAWIDLQDTDNLNNDLRLRGRQAGAALFDRGEGLTFGHGQLFISCTQGGPARKGQVFRYVPSPREGQSDETSHPGRLQLFQEVSDLSRLDMPDNVAVAPWGHLMICEDKEGAGAVNFLRGVTPEGWLYTLARNPAPYSSNVGANAELAGVCFSPDGTTLFVNVYTPGMTLAITGPWARFSNART